MSATSFKAADAPRRTDSKPSSSSSEDWGRKVDIALAVIVLAMLGLMLVEQGEETIPYHLLFLALTITYGFRVWPILPTVVVISAVTVTTGVIMYSHYRAGLIEAPELAEIPLMPALLAAMVWHARRRAEAQLQSEVMAEQRRASIEREREFFRDTSHAIRTPVTIARGHLELIEPSLVDDLAREDIRVALRQLDRMTSLSSHLLAIAQLDAGADLNPTRVDLRDFGREVNENWRTSADREWVVAGSTAAPVFADAEWLGLAVDAIVENAVRFTAPGDRITMSTTVLANSCTITVTDTGPGISAEDLPHIFDRFWHRRPPSGDMGSGLGLSMARATARALGGDLTAAVSGKGAAFTLSLPRHLA